MLTGQHVDRVIDTPAAFGALIMNSSAKIHDQKCIFFYWNTYENFYPGMIDKQVLFSSSPK